MGERVGQRGSCDRSGEALRTAEVRGSASAVGGGADLLLVGAEPKDEQGLRAAARELEAFVYVAMSRLMVRRLVR